MSLVKRKQTIFVDSTNRTRGGITDCYFHFDSDLVKATKQETIQLRLKDFTQRNGYYDVVTSQNDAFVINPTNPAGPNIQTGVNDSFNIAIGSVNPAKYKVTLNPGYYTLRSLAGNIQTVLNNEPTGKIFAVTYDDSESAGQFRFKFFDTSSSATQIFTLDFSPSALNTVLGYTQQTYGTGTPSNKYVAERTNLQDNAFTTTIVSLPQGFYDLDRATTVLQNLFPFSGGSFTGDPNVYQPWTVSGDGVTNTISFAPPAGFPSVDFVFNSPLVSARYTQQLLGFGQSIYTVANAAPLTSDQEVRLTRVSNIVIHVDCIPRHANQSLDNYTNSAGILSTSYFKHSNILARIPVDVGNGSLIGWRNIQNDFEFLLATDRLTDMRVWLTDELNAPLYLTQDSNWNAVFTVEFLDESTQTQY